MRRVIVILVNYKKKGDTVASPPNVPVRTRMYDYCFWKGKSSTPVKSDNFCFSSNPKQPKRPVVLVWLRSDRENIPHNLPCFI